MKPQGTGTNGMTDGRPEKNDLLIVGIGASAGGIQALQQFFKQVPANSDMAYVVILHLSPDHDSKLVEVLQHVSNIPVRQVTEETKVEANQVYVVPPNKHLMMSDGAIVVSPNMQEEDRRAPVDIFFRTLANSHGSRSICVVLSGTGANGSMGLKRIKEMGGAAFVQNPREAEFNEMPRNAIATDMVDEVLPVAEIPRKILLYKGSLGTVHIPLDAENRAETQQQALREIFTHLRLRTGHDFANYKRPTVLRRIERRVNIKNLPDLPAYAGYLQANPEEVSALLKDLLISVTNFFRDKKAFEVIEHEILPAILSKKKPEEHLRIWVAGCASGEEAYSIAMLCAEKVLNVLDAPKIQVFATDIDEAAITFAREGLYTLNDAADVSPERLRRFFNKEGDGYRIRREIREMILFANHNFIKDPPFSHLDLVSCRNVLIYLNQSAQERVMETFHFALNPGGYLCLGLSESVDSASDLFLSINREYHLFQSRQVAVRTYPVPESVPGFNYHPVYNVQPGVMPEHRVRERMTLGDLHQRLLEQYAPPSVVVNEEYEIVHLSERAGRYLQIAGGEPSQNLLKLVKQELRLELRSALYQAVQRQSAVEARGLKVNVHEKSETINIHVRPVFREDDVAKGFILVIFERTEDEVASQQVVVTSDEPVARHLEEELMRLKAQLRSSVEQHEFQAEELKASNEELQAMNEELRSAAEELETSKEELQSINEELRTVNQELKVKVEETTIAGNYLQNLINSVDIGTIFLDRNFRVALFTPAALTLFNLIPNDTGRPLSDITHKLAYNELIHDAETVLHTLQAVEREVSATDGRIFMARVLPYRTEEDRINGVILTFFDITRRKQDEELVRLAKERMERAFSIDTVGIVFFKPTGEITGANDAFLRMCGYTREEMTEGRILRGELIPDEYLVQSGKGVKELNATGRTTPYQREYIRKDGSKWWALFSAARISEEEAVEFVIDISEQKKLELQKDEFITVASHELKTPVTSIKVYADVLQEQIGNDEDKMIRDMVQKLNGQVDRLNNLIGELLDTSKIGEDRLILKPVTLNINGLIAEKIEELQPLAKKSKLIFKPGKLPEINADKERIEQVLTNLVSNAIKYSPGGGDITIATEKTDHVVKVSVQDKGIGIPAGMLNDVFGRFFRIPNPQVQTFPGMGLGLYISAAIVERHGGTISVESKEDEGSTFSFTLPLNHNE